MGETPQGAVHREGEGAGHRGEGAGQRWREQDTGGGEHSTGNKGTLGGRTRLHHGTK